MAETPSTKPTDNFFWPAATNGVSEPDSGLRNAGWAPGDAPPAEEFNWWWQKIGATLEWARDNAVRRFATLPEAIAATEAGELFMVAHAFVPLCVAEDVTITAPGWEVRAICSDGQRVFMASDNTTGEIKAYTATPSGSPTALWALTGLDIDPLDMSTDGNVVAVANGITGSPNPKSVIIYDAADGSVLYTDTDNSYCYSVAAGGVDSAGDPRVYWGTHLGGTSNIIYRWDGTSRVSVATGLRDIKAIATGGGIMVAAYSPDGTKVGIQAWAVTADSSGHTVVLDATQTADPGRSQALATDGERIYWLVTGASGVDDHRLFCYLVGTAKTLLWTATLGDVTHAPHVQVDDRYVYATWQAGGNRVVAVIDKRTGAVITYHDPSDTQGPFPSAARAAWCIDGSHIWCSLDGESFVIGRGTGRQPTMWRRRADATPSEMAPTTLLAQPVGGTR